MYGACFQRRAANLGMDQILTAPRSPWQHAVAERLIGSIRRECLDQVIVLSQGLLRRLLATYFLPLLPPLAYAPGAGHGLPGHPPGTTA